MKKAINNIITAIAVIVYIWFAASFIQINMHNRLGDEPLSEKQTHTNLICIMSVMFN